MKKGISLRLSLGYAVGAVGEAGFYQFVTAFQLVFLTGVVKLSPGLAGTITSLTILMDAVCSVLIGKFSDQLRGRFGRRRPFILFAVFSIPITMTLSFTTIHQSTAVMFVYYTIMGALAWTAYAAFYIPYTALGGEVATDYNDRIRIRSLNRIFNIIANFFATVLPLTVIQFLMGMGIGETSGWFYFTLVFGVSIGLGLFICWWMTRGSEPCAVETAPGKEGPKKESLLLVFRDFWQLLRIKSMAILISAKVMFMVAFTFYTSGQVFFMQYRLGLSGEKISAVYLISVIASAVYTPVISWMAMKLGKQQAVIISLCVSGVFGMGFYAAGIHNYFTAVLYVIVFMFVQSSYWQISNAIFYDITEVDEYVYGSRREGGIAALQSIAGTLAAALGLQLIGFFLNAAGFDANLAVQSGRAMTELSRIFVLYPSIALILSAALLYTYPVSRRRFIMLQNVIEMKKQGEDYSAYEEELNKLI